MARTFPRVGEAEFGRFHLSSHLLADAFADRGYVVEWLNTDAFLAEVGDKMLGFSVTRGPLSDLFSNYATTRKDVAAALLRRAGVAVAEGRAFSRRERVEAMQYGRELGWPIVVKPASSSAGQGVSVGIGSDEELLEAWQRAGEVRGRLRIIERHFAGREARFCVLGGRCRAVVGKRPPFVTGDGRSTVAQLVDAKNEERRRSPLYFNRPIEISGRRTEVLAAEGLDLDSVPAKGTHVQIDLTGNLSRGAEAVDLTDVVHPAYLEVAGRAASAVPGLRLAGVDILARDFSQPPTPDNHIVIEMNSWPGIGGHHFPSQGQSRDVAGEIVEYVIGTQDR